MVLQEDSAGLSCHQEVVRNTKKEPMFVKLITTNHYQCCLLYTLSINLFLSATEEIIAALVLHT